MNVEDLRMYCLDKAEVNESFPFGETALVFKVNGKMFALLGLEAPLSINLKCDPELAIELRERYLSVSPGYHMNKRLWNTVLLDGDIEEEEIKKWIDHSYHLVVEKMPKKDRQRILDQ